MVFLFKHNVDILFLNIRYMPLFILLLEIIQKKPPPKIDHYPNK